MEASLKERFGEPWFSDKERCGEPRFSA